MPNKKTSKGSKNRVAAVVRQSMHTQLLGRSRRPPPLPRVIITAHWNPATVVHFGSGDAELSVNDIANELRDQYGLFATDSTNRIPIALRFRAVQFWNLNTVTIGDSQVILRNLTNFGEMIRLTCQPALNQWARCGYAWPDSQQFIQHNHDDTTNKPIKVDVRTDRWLLHISCLWRSLNGQTNASIARRYEEDRSLVALPSISSLEIV